MRMSGLVVEGWVEDLWEASILPALESYIRIPNKSPLFDPAWREHGHMDRAVAEVAAWCRSRNIPGLVVEVIEDPDRTPLLYIEVPGQSDDTVLLYGHLDKQPEMVGWEDGLGPWLPVRRGARLYGRGGADDGYAAFASLTALELLTREQVPHARCVLLIECCEESGSPDLPEHMRRLLPRIGQPSLVVCLDSGCGNYDQMWGTTSLRGMVTGELTVDVLDEGVHSGDAGGIVPSSFRILRQLLSRIEDEATGRVFPPELNAEIPEDRVAEARKVAGEIGDAVFTKFPFAGSTSPPDGDPAELILNRTWRPALAITGLGGAPAPSDAGNVLRPSTTAKLSLRLPPSIDGEAATAAVKALLEADPPSGAGVHFEAEPSATGWNAPPIAPWLEQAVDAASQACFARPALFMGEGGTIPFMSMLGDLFPEAQFLITGVLGPASNAHGPNEFLHIPTAKRLTTAVARILADHHRRT
ncbi:MAG: M20 family metallopeptidase [Deltaproteobacteria bacterium]|nr:M20 family metallopeptidase [Deltaproteobacteria bacterium]MBW2395714.1 M20 family metallopeptidase [Deltaproteobacteria bacterium]